MDRARQRSGTGGRAAPLAACASGPPCRVVLKEQVLAALLARGDPGGTITAQLTPTVFSTRGRFETYMAFLAANPVGSPGPEEIQARLADRLQRAPGWAAGYTGSPAATWPWPLQPPASRPGGNGEQCNIDNNNLCIRRYCGNCRKWWRGQGGAG